MNRIFDGFKFGLGFGCAMLVFYFVALIVILIIAGMGILSTFR